MQLIFRRVGCFLSLFELDFSGISSHMWLVVLELSEVFLNLLGIKENIKFLVGRVRYGPKGLLTFVVGPLDQIRIRVLSFCFGNFRQGSDSKL